MRTKVKCLKDNGESADRIYRETESKERAQNPQRESAFPQFAQNGDWYQGSPSGVP
jgi:hypothetical protein